MSLWSRTIPCKKCGKKGETMKTIAGWFCEDCLSSNKESQLTNNSSKEDTKDD